MLPNFIVIGAAKAGTTALYWYLAEHPQVFMSPVKETNYFAYGVDEEGRSLFGDPELHYFPITTLQEYEELFRDAGTALAVVGCPPARTRSASRRQRSPTKPTTRRCGSTSGNPTGGDVYSALVTDRGAGR